MQNFNLIILGVNPSHSCVLAAKEDQSQIVQTIFIPEEE